MENLPDNYDSYPALLWNTINQDEKIVQCNLCSFNCIIKEGQTGVCLTRYNCNGELFTTTYGNIDGLAIDPIEKKPFFHFKPGSSVLSFGTPGCNFKCLNCQNSYLSQRFRNNKKLNTRIGFVAPKSIIDTTYKYQIQGIAYTYSEPTIFFEYARDIILECRKHQNTYELFHVFISNGYMSESTIELIHKEKLISAINIDLKFINNHKYKEITGANLEPILRNIRIFNELRNEIFLEIINLVIPDENESDDDFIKTCEFLASVSNDIPLHFSRFFPNNKMMNKSATSIERLLRAKEIAQSIGLKYIYLGNANIKESENTYCPNCNHLLIERFKYSIDSINFIDNKPICPKCGTKINIFL